MLASGMEISREFFSWDLGEIEPSAMTDFPSNYKFTSVEIWMDHDLSFHNRESYNFLDFCGDIGGLFDALFLFGTAITAYFAVRQQDC